MSHASWQGTPQGPYSPILSPPAFPGTAPRRAPAQRVMPADPHEENPVRSSVPALLSNARIISFESRGDTEAGKPGPQPRQHGVGSMDQADLIVGIGGAAGDGVASAGNTLALSVARQGPAVYSYNSYQSVIPGGHSWLRLRLSAEKAVNHGDQVDALIALDPDTLERHLPGPVRSG